MVATVAIDAAVGIAASTFEAALLPAMVLGIATIWAPANWGCTNPLLRRTIRDTFKIGDKTREVMAEAQGSTHDMIVDVDAKCDLNLKHQKVGYRLMRAPHERSCVTGLN